MTEAISTLMCPKTTDIPFMSPEQPSAFTCFLISVNDTKIYLVSQAKNLRKTMHFTVGKLQAIEYTLQY